MNKRQIVKNAKSFIGCAVLDYFSGEILTENLLSKIQMKYKLFGAGSYQLAKKFIGKKIISKIDFLNAMLETEFTSINEAINKLELSKIDFSKSNIGNIVFDDNNNFGVVIKSGKVLTPKGFAYGFVEEDINKFVYTANISTEEMTNIDTLKK